MGAVLRHIREEFRDSELRWMLLVTTPLPGVVRIENVDAYTCSSVGVQVACSVTYCGVCMQQGAREFYPSERCCVKTCLALICLTHPGKSK